MRGRGALFLTATVWLGGCGICPVVENLVLAPMDHEDIYVTNGGSCLKAGDPDKKRKGPFFSDSECSHEIPFVPTPFKRFCKNNLDEGDHTRDYIGNPVAWRQENPDVENLWTLSQGSRLRVAAFNQTVDAKRPFLRKVEYRKVGSCSLGMHIYKSRIDATGLKPALFIYGGGWTRRGPPAIAAMETLAPNLTEKGYIVFAPFHRVLQSRGDNLEDCPAACGKGTGKDIVEDIEAALEWVLENGADFGMDADLKKVVTIGQSSGAHLAAYLAVHHKDAVERTLLLYPPTDLLFLAEELKEGGIYEGEFESVKDLLLRYADKATLEDIDPADEFFQKNSYPAIVDKSPGDYPPFFIIHGTDDELVPIEQSTRLCEGLDPNRHPSGERYDGGGAVIACGEESKLHVIDGANHILDLRCFSERFLKVARMLDIKIRELDSICPSGEEGAPLVQQALAEAYGDL